MKNTCTQSFLVKYDDNISVTYDNNLHLTRLGILSAKEQDIFFTVCSAFSDKRCDEITMPISKLRGLSKLGPENNVPRKTFDGYLKQVKKKLQTIKFEGTSKDGENVEGTMFILFVEDPKSDTLRVVLNPYFYKYFFGVESGFTWFLLSAFTKVRTKYAKTLFRYLYQYRSTGIWLKNFDEFRDIMEFPAGQSNSQVMRSVNAAISELKETGIFEDITCISTKKAGRGRALDKITFHFKESKQAQAERIGQTIVEPIPVMVKKEVHTHKLVTDPETLITTGIDHVETEEQHQTCTEKDKNGNVCGANLVIKIAHTGPNKGKRYQVCENHIREGGSYKCKYFKWIDPPEKKRNEPPNEPIPKE